MLGELLRRHEYALTMHEVMPDAYEVRQMQVEFEPLDLARMPVGSLWLDGFAEVEADDEIFDAAPTLHEIAKDWSHLDPKTRAERGIVATFGRQEIIEQLRELLGAARPATVVLVGPPRVGKTSIIKHLALLNAQEPGEWEDGAKDEETPLPRRMWFADAPRLTSTDPQSGGWQEQCAQVVAELEEHDDLLYMGSLIQAFDAGKYVGSDYNLAQFLKPHLSDRRLRVVAEATVEERTRVEQRDVGFARALHVLRVADPPEDETRATAEQAGRRPSSAPGAWRSASPPREARWAGRSILSGARCGARPNLLCNASARSTWSSASARRPGCRR